MKRFMAAALLLLAPYAVGIEATLTQASATSAVVNCPQGYKLAWLYRGTFDSATAKVQSQDADDDWNDVPDTDNTTANGGIVTCFTVGEKYRITSSGGGVSQSLEVELEAFRERVNP